MENSGPSRIYIYIYSRIYLYFSGLPGDQNFNNLQRVSAPIEREMNNLGIGATVNRAFFKMVVILRA